MFSWLIRDQPGALDKIYAVAGDLTSPGLGISSHDLNLIIEDVSIVINSAASVRFDDDLKQAIETNVKGPRQLLALSQKIKNLEVGFHVKYMFFRSETTDFLQAFVHVSTAFNSLHREVVDEKIYPPKVDPVKLVTFLESLDTDFSRSITEQ